MIFADRLGRGVVARSSPKKGVPKDAGRQEAYQLRVALVVLARRHGWSVRHLKVAMGLPERTAYDLANDADQLEGVFGG